MGRRRLDPQRSPAGLIDDLDAFRRDGFDPDRVDPSIRRFYEHTADFDLHVEARWSICETNAASSDFNASARCPTSTTRCFISSQSSFIR